MFKNVASQKLIVFAFDTTTNAPKTGDAANITAYVSKDYGAVTVLTDTSATEMDATNAKGYYLFDLAQAETNADTLLFSAKSSTANIVVIAVPATVFTLPPSFTSFVTPTNLTAAQIATGVWQDTTAGDFTVASSIGKSLYTSGNAPGAASGIAIVGSNMGTVTSVTGSVNSVTSGVTVTANNDKTGYSLTVTPPTAAQVATAVWQDTTAGDFTVANSIGKSLGGSFTAIGTSVFTIAALANAPSGGGGGGDPWATAFPGSYTASQFGGVFATMSTEVASLLGSTITYTGPVATSGTVTLVRADDYKNSDGRALTFTNAAGSWPTLTSGSVAFTVLSPAALSNSQPTPVITQSGTIVAGANGSSQTVRFDLSKSQTAQAVGTYSYAVTATLANGDIVTLAVGTCYVTQGQTP